MNRILVAVSIIGLLFLSTLPTFIPKALAATIVVPDDYSTIQAAINAANDGDTIFVRSERACEDKTI
jgi:hypothetical protein